MRFAIDSKLAKSPSRPAVMDAGFPAPASCCRARPRRSRGRGCSRDSARRSRRRDSARRSASASGTGNRLSGSALLGRLAAVHEHAFEVAEGKIGGRENRLRRSRENRCRRRPADDSRESRCRSSCRRPRRCVMRNSARAGGGDRFRLGRYPTVGRGFDRCISATRGSAGASTRGGAVVHERSCRQPHQRGEVSRRSSASHRARRMRRTSILRRAGGCAAC